jgi:hypothetical protein
MTSSNQENGFVSLKKGRTDRRWAGPTALFYERKAVPRRCCWLRGVFGRVRKPLISLVHGGSTTMPEGERTATSCCACGRPISTAACSRARVSDAMEPSFGRRVERTAAVPGNGGAREMARSLQHACEPTTTDRFALTTTRYRISLVGWPANRRALAIC